MSTVIAKNIQIGTSGTPAQNFTWYQPAAPDGTVRLGVGNTGATTLDAVTVANTGNVTLGGTTTLTNISYSGTLTGGTGIVNLGSGQFYKDASGNVGIGVTPSAWRSGHSVIQLGGGTGLSLASGAASGYGLFQNAYLDAVGQKYTNNGFASYYYQFNGGHFWATAASGTAGNAISFTQVAQIDVTGARSTVVPSGSTLYPAFDCRAWVNFNGTTSPGTIRASGNVSSVTKNGTGDYTVNFTSAMPDRNYAVTVGNGRSDTGYATLGSTTTPTASAYRLTTWNGFSALADGSEVYVAVFR